MKLHLPYFRQKFKTCFQNEFHLLLNVQNIILLLSFVTIYLHILFETTQLEEKSAEFSKYRIPLDLSCLCASVPPGNLRKNTNETKLSNCCHRIIRRHEILSLGNKSNARQFNSNSNVRTYHFMTHSLTTCVVKGTGKITRL